jgi:microcystin-dependent protein
MSEPFLGEIKIFAGNFAPRGYAKCDGQLMAISQHQELFSILGTIYGGDGRTTFALPDLRGRAPVHAGTGPGLEPVQLGQRGGQSQITLNINQMPPHTHQVECTSEDGETEEAPDSFLSKGANGEQIYSSSSDGSRMNSGMITPAGAGQPFSIVSPFMGVNYIISIQGIIPTRGER